jgi:hypothetical protein
MSWRWDSNVWIGSPFSTLPWLDQLRPFMLAAEHEGCVSGFRLKSFGSEFLEISSDLDGDVRRLATALPFLDTLVEARHICRTLKLNAVFPAKWTKQDFDDIEELFGLITTGGFVSRRKYNFAFTSTAIAEEHCNALKERKALTLREGMATGKFFGVDVDWSDVVVELSEWRDSRFKNVVKAGERLTEVKLTGCTQKLLWERFRDNPSVSPER